MCRRDECLGNVFLQSPASSLQPDQAVVAAHAGKPLGKISAAHELLDHLRDDRAQKAVCVLVGLGVDVPLQAGDLRL